MRHQVINAAEGREAAADGFGKVRFAAIRLAKRLCQNGAQLRFHGTPVLGGPHAQPLLERRLNVADGQVRSGGF